MEKEKQSHWFSSPAVVAVITAVGTLAVAIVGQYSFADKTICGIREIEMREIFAAYNDELSQDLDWAMKAQSQMVALATEHSEQITQLRSKFESQLNSIKQRYDSGEKIQARDFMVAFPGTGYPGRIEVPAARSRTEFQRKLGALYARCLR